MKGIAETVTDVYSSPPDGYPFNNTDVLYYTIRVTEEIKVSTRFFKFMYNNDQKLNVFSGGEKIADCH